MSLKEFLHEERAALQELSTEFSPEYQEQVLRSFIESPLLPGGSFNLLLLAEGTSNAEPLQNLAQAAYDRFVSAYLEQVSNYAVYSVAELSGEDVPVLSGQVTCSEQLDRLLELFAVARSGDPVLEWFINEGAAILNEVRRGIMVKDVEGLAALIHQLEYYLLFFPSDSGEAESYNFIVDLPERMTTELAELGLVVVERETELLSSVRLDPGGFSQQLVQEFIQLVDWQRCVLTIETKESGSIAGHVEEWKPENMSRPEMSGTSHLKIPPTAEQPTLVIGAESVKVHIRTTGKDRGSLDAEKTRVA